ncbi:MAG: YecA family protein [Rhodocyclaceae bacterium]|nr:YecA family protein [Rhodocyclaceae bacterium]
MNQQPLTEGDLDRLEELLDSPAFKGEAMRLDEIQALLCAVVSSPETILPSTWLPEALGEEPEYESEAQAMEIMELLMRLNNDIARSLQDGETVALILYPLDEEGNEYDYASWADAYVYGCGLGSDWFELADKHAEDLSELLEPMFLLNGMMKEDVEKSGEKWLSPAEEARLVEEMQEDLPDIVLAIYDFWRAKEGSSTTIRRETEKVGRNDPCPCGSGKKFKQCCGQPDKLH